MIEALIAGKAVETITLPLSGPGNKTLLFGTTDLGYFGRVSQDELFTSKELLDFTGITTGTVGPINFQWMKFIRAGKVIYISTALLRTAISWNILYELGLIYGTNDNGLYPTATPTNQLKWKVKEDKGKKWFLKARTIKGTNTDPYASASDNVLDSEWDQLMGRVMVGSHANAGVWEKNALNDVAAVLFTLAQETWVLPNNTTAYVTRGGNYNGPMYVGQVSKPSTLANYGYRPVFELFDGSTLTAEPAEVIGKLTEGINAPKTFTAVNGDAPAKRPRVISGTLTPAITPPNKFTATMTNPVFKTTLSGFSVDFKLTALSFTVV